ncbi:hypothetical protein NEUTE1DRAFT_108646 [Neurospora tetrasperma FGSC 2508]|uniref:Uncharacterized protein n=1 Tax=Neurospora tetrasperma (strain FGSC 2508 / ATCC MYA-4615 / P0657) TaxID=510951 RepID=F8MJA4_NEUT8|nr:uncharacterized protein NEUTE1DRAFT_108646 [Neurospora tetrasperma FGSC 2508]EGO59101.1 hypothetical protein NEUTE1DRAFT_108646 [Neurospora tetrasperma FGSC 2508]EGZ73207.1 hypothetical protein NEUTE2DRAFT_60015 [Neurospora tetrasperma FGSC 2509]
MNGYLHRFTDYLYVLDYRPSLSPPAPAAGGNRLYEYSPKKARPTIYRYTLFLWKLKGVNVSTNKADIMDANVEKDRSRLPDHQVDSLINLSALPDIHITSPACINGVGVVTSCFRYAAPVTGGGWGDYLR